MAEDYTIDELAAAVGMTVRNVRAHQARGLLPPPRLVGRVGYYGAFHRQRLEQITQMQSEGLNLAAIARILNDGQLTAISAELFDRPEPRSFPTEEILRRLGVTDTDPGLLHAIELGFVEIDGETIRLHGPGLLAVAEELMELGVPLTEQLDVLATVRDALSAVAEAYLRLGDRALFEAIQDRSAGDDAAFRAAMARMRDLARLTVHAAFDQAMAHAMAERFEPQSGVTSLWAADS
jgi:DNA-binding transcriptional MerR regulator